MTEDPRAVRSRQMLQDALIDLIEEKGFDAISVSDIVKKAGLSRAVFYLHYGDKNDLLETAIGSVLEDLRASLPGPNFEDRAAPDQRAPRPFISLFEHVKSDARFYRIMLSEEKAGTCSAIIRTEIEQDAKKRIQQFRSRGAHRPLVPLEINEHFSAGAVVNVLRWWLEMEQPYSPETMAKYLYRLYAMGSIQCLGVEPGEAIDPSA